MAAHLGSSSSTPRLCRRRRVVAVLGLALAACVTVRATPVEFDLPAQPADAALLAFSRQAGVEILFAFEELHRVASTEVKGRLEPDAALGRLLQDTGFAARRNGAGKFVVSATRGAGGTIQGRLLKPDGAPASGVRVAILGTPRVVSADANGSFELRAVPAGTYELWVTGEGYQPLKITAVAVAGRRAVTLEAQTLRSAADPTRLDPVVVVGQPPPRRPFDRSELYSVPRTATGNLDLPRSENDALSYTIFDRDQIMRSGVVSLNEFLQKELLDSNASQRPPEQDGSQESFITGSTNLSLRGYDPDETVILVNGRRLPEVLTSGMEGAPAPDVNLIPLSLVQEIEVLPVSASALYTGNPVGGVINILLRPDVDANATEVTATYTNALRGFDAPQSSLSLVHAQSLLGGALRMRLNASFTRALPPTEAELGLHRRRARFESTPSLDSAVFRATPNVRSADATPLFGAGSSTVTSVAPGSDGSGGLAAFSGRNGVRNFDFFDSPGGLATSLQSSDYPYGRRQQRASYFLSAVYDATPWLQAAIDVTHARTVVNRGYDVASADLTLGANSPFNPFKQDVLVSLNEIAPALGERYSEARVEFSSAVAGLLFKLPDDWRVSVDTQYAHNLSRYRGLAGVDAGRWQDLVDRGLYNPLRDTQVHGAPSAFYDEVLIYRGHRGSFVTLGDYDTLDAALRATNRAFHLPTGEGSLNVGADYRRNHLAKYTDERRFADDTLAEPAQQWSGRSLQRYSVFGELQAPLVPERHRPTWLRGAEADLAVRYVASGSSSESNVAPTYGLKIDLAGGLSLRGSFTTSNRFPTPHMSRKLALPPTDSGGDGGFDQVQVLDPMRNESYGVGTTEAVNPDLRPESAVTQTAGILFQRGTVHRFRAALDFVDTRKTDELKALEPQEVLALESLVPDRVRRAVLAPGDTHSVGRVTELITGTTNLAWRHSQNWNASVDYAWTECFGGALQVYGRLVYFERYDRQVLPTSPTVSELRHPDGGASGLLKYRANLGGGWFGRRLGAGFDAHYFHSRVLPQFEWASQGHDRIRPHWQEDVYLQADFGRWLEKKHAGFGLQGQVRINNVFK
jgi:iron complex outermembrane receptor protein